MPIESKTLAGRIVRLEPLSESHHAGLTAVGLSPLLWDFTPARITSPGHMMKHIREALEATERGEQLAFVLVATDSETIVGSTRFLHIDPPNRKLEIGWTWIADRWQRTGINQEAKYLLLREAFETLGVVRVEFAVDLLNFRARKSVLGIGATEEGTLRRHMVNWDGNSRDTVYYSILDSEWPDVKRAFESRLKRGSSGP